MMQVVTNNIPFILLSILFLIWGSYESIKYICLKKASETIVDAEAKKELTGSEKLALCVVWIEEELPKVFRNTLLQSLIKKFVNFIYDNSFSFMKNYIKRKTGYDISELIKTLQENDLIKTDENKEENSGKE